MLCMCCCENKDESVCRGRLSCTVHREALLKYLDVEGHITCQLIPNLSISDPTERPGQPILCFPFGAYETATFLTYCYAYDHSLMCSVCLSLCLSAWITSNHSAEKQLSELTFSKQWGEHSEISIRLPSPVPTVFVGPLHGISPLSHSKLEPFGVPYKMNPVYLMSQPGNFVCNNSLYTCLYTLVCTFTPSKSNTMTWVQNSVIEIDDPFYYLCFVCMCMCA